jgi:diguanylate cyclase (GGDEF)-like protein/PAS domain S-box-containing protein
MNSKSVQSLNKSNSRTEAEYRLAIKPPKITTHSEQELLHELQVHQIELEMQNDELMQTLDSLDRAHSRYLDLYELAPVGYLTLSPEGKIIEINLTASNLLDVDRDKLLNHNFSNWIVASDADDWHLQFKSMLQKKFVKKRIELRLKRNNTDFHAWLECLPTKNPNQQQELRITLTDITEQKQNEEALRIAAVTFDAQECIIITNANKAILRTNKAFTETTGYCAEDVLGLSPNMLKSGRHNEIFYDDMWKCINKNGYWQGEVWGRRKNGDIYPQLLTITAVKDAKGKVTHYVYMHSDISQRKAYEDEIKQLAFFDPLTTLPNRRLLGDRLKQALAASVRSEKYGALLFIDLDNFKSLNDNLGHDMGDLLLQQVAQRLNNCVRGCDTVSRQGGDEFIIMLEELSENAEEAAIKAKTIGEKVLVSLNQSYHLGNNDFQSTPSIGITLFINHQYTINELLKRADLAMYEAKSAGRNTLRFYDQRMQEAVTARTLMETDLRCALAKNQFELYFQRQIHNETIVGAEVLLRWNHPTCGFIPPLTFIPIAEETGIINAIGYWVLETICAQLNYWKNNIQTQNLKLSVNISPCQLQQVNFVERVSELLEMYDITADKLIFEFNESRVFDGNINQIIIKMKQLKALGVNFSMDNFGSSYSSLIYLTQLPFDQLKIDQSFVLNIGIKPNDTTIVQTIIGMTDNLSMNVVANGVETHEQRAFLEQHGCHTFQGFLLGHPMSQEEFERSLDLIRDRSSACVNLPVAASA